MSGIVPASNADRLLRLPIMIIMLADLNASFYCFALRSNIHSSLSTWR